MSQAPSSPPSSCLHQPGVEHGLQLLSLAAQHSGRARRGRTQLSSGRLDALLAAGGPVRDASAHLEHDDVDVRRLVLRGRSGGDQRRQYHGHAARSRRLHREGHPGPNLGAIGWAIAAMAIVILVYDQLLFRPLIASADWFRSSRRRVSTPSRSWALTMMRRSRRAPSACDSSARHSLGFNRGGERQRPPRATRAAAQQLTPLGDSSGTWSLRRDRLAMWRIVAFILDEFRGGSRACRRWAPQRFSGRDPDSARQRVWVPIGVYIGIRPRLARAVQPIAHFWRRFRPTCFFPSSCPGSSSGT